MSTSIKERVGELRELADRFERESDATLSELLPHVKTYSEFAFDYFGKHRHSTMQSPAEFWRSLGYYGTIAPQYFPHSFELSLDTCTDDHVTIKVEHRDGDYDHYRLPYAWIEDPEATKASLIAVWTQRWEERQAAKAEADREERRAQFERLKQEFGE